MIVEFLECEGRLPNHQLSAIFSITGYTVCMSKVLFLCYLIHDWQNATCDSVEHAIVRSANTSITVDRNDNLSRSKQRL